MPDTDDFNWTIDVTVADRKTLVGVQVQPDGMVSLALETHDGRGRQIGYHQSLMTEQALTELSANLALALLQLRMMAEMEPTH